MRLQQGLGAGKFCSTDEYPSVDLLGGIRAIVHVQPLESSSFMQCSVFLDIFHRSQFDGKNRARGNLLYLYPDPIRNLEISIMHVFEAQRLAAGQRWSRLVDFLVVKTISLLFIALYKSLIARYNGSRKINIIV